MNVTRGIRWFFRSTSFAVLAFLYAPLLVIAVLSFNRSPVTGFPFRGFTFAWYEKVFRTPEFLGAFGNSIGVGVLAAFIACALALCLAPWLRWHPGLMQRLGIAADRFGTSTGTLTGLDAIG